MKIPIRVSKLAQSLGQPCEVYIMQNEPDLYERTTQKPDPDDIPVPDDDKYCKVPLLVFAAGRGRIRPWALKSF
jgi:hypothetical protein